MNYSHAFHAGNFADVMKHLVLSRLIDYLKRKPAGFRMIDTHAGIGLYDLHGEAAGRTGEWREGIGRLLAAKLPDDVAALCAPYLDAVHSLNPDGGLRFYPGSPLLARKLFRPQDRLEALELHPGDARTLAALFAGDHQVRVIALDGWLALNAHLPPKERRWLVLVDPPFEAAGEFERLADGLARAHRKFATGLFALWYPLKDAAAVRAFHRALDETGIARVLKAELTLRAPSTPARLFGSGLILVNPPFTLEAELRRLLPALRSVLAPAHGGWRLEWIRGEG